MVPSLIGSAVRARYRKAMTALLGRGRRHVELQAFRGYGTPTRLLLRGRVLRASGLTRSRLGDSVLVNLRNMLRRFESDEVPGALVAARAALGDEVRARTDGEGYFELILDLPRPLTDPRVWEPVELELLAPAAPSGVTRATAQVLVPRDPQYAVISDLDDTVLHSNATSLWQMARMTLLHNAHTRLPFEGVAGFYQALQRGRDGEALNPVFYVSNSPWNLYDLLEDFLDLQGIPRGPLLLRDWSLRRLKAGEAHKLAAIQALLDAYPGLQVVLVGDSGERDPEIYRQVVLRHPGRVLAVYVRDVAPGRHDAVRAIAAELAGHGVELVLSPDTEAARRHALDRGLIVAAALPGDR
jgi:phosphatidate phosphatase APP1